MSSEGGPEESTASSSVLRAVAPVFVPSSSLAIAPATFGSVSPPNEGQDNNENNRNRRSGRQSTNQQTKKTKSRRQRQRRQRRQENDENDGDDLDESRKIKNNGVKGKDQDCSLRSKTKSDKKGRQRNGDTASQSKKNNGKSGTARIRKGYNENYQHDYDGHNGDSAVMEELEIASSIAFPALMEDPTLPSSLDHQKLQPTIWNSVKVVKEIREGQSHLDSIKEQEVFEEKEAEKWRNGLDRLTSHDKNMTPIHAFRQEFLSWDENHDDEPAESDRNRENRETNDSLAIGHETVRSALHIAPGESVVVGSDRRTFNINRLRDRWWTAVADQQRRLRQMEAEELEQQQQHQQQKQQAKAKAELEINHNDEDENTKTNPTEISSADGEIDSADLQPKVNQTVPLCQEAGSKLKLLDLAIEQNDDQALRDMIDLEWNSNRTPSSEVLDGDKAEESGEDLVEHAVTVLIRRNHPTLLRTILSITRGKVPINSKPLLQAARLGHEECASILLSKQEKGSTMLFMDDVVGNTALHYCCRENGNKDMLRILLKQVVGTTKRKRQQLLKLVTTRNKYLQTALHVACESGRNDLVEVFLTTCKSSVLFKLLSIEDAKLETPLLCAVSNNSSDVVLSLLMWRRNHDHQRQKQPQAYSATGSQYTNDANPNQISRTNRAKNASCPLFWAAKSGNLEMIDLLLQFGDQSGTRYQATDALLTLLRADVPDDSKLKGSNSLILAGGNPFEEFQCPGSVDREKESSISVAAKFASGGVLRSIISTALQLVEKRQLYRRRDPVLQQQPEAFFKTLECKENSEAEKAISDALVESLIRAHLNRKYSDFSKAIVLYEKIGKLRDEYLSRLQNGLRTGNLTLAPYQPRKWCFFATYRHSRPGRLDCDRSALTETSLSLLQLPWFHAEFSKGECFCPWMSSNSENDHSPLHLVPKDALTLIANDGSRFLVHAPTMSEKSEKIASALRFARMKSGDDAFDEVTTLEFDIAPDFVVLMIQHMYHGSIFFGWANLDNSVMCRYLLELMIIAEEFLMPSLVQEIEMRLMSSEPKKCFCWDCCQVCRYTASDDGKEEAECLFFIDGSSRLINRDTAVDVLSLTDFIGGLDYKIFMAQIAMEFCVQPENMWAIYDREATDQNLWKFKTALGFLRNVAILTILKEFAHVVKCPDFFIANEGDQRDESQKHVLLQICLDELRNNSSMTMDPDTSMIRANKIFYPL